MKQKINVILDWLEKAANIIETIVPTIRKVEALLESNKTE